MDTIQRYKNFKTKDFIENFFIGIYHYKGFQQYYIFSLEINHLDNEKFSGVIFEKEDFEIKENPIPVSGIISTHNIEFTKTYKDKSEKYAKATSMDISAFHFPLESRQVKHIGTSEDGILYKGHWEKKLSGIIFMGEEEDDEILQGEWEMRKL